MGDQDGALKDLNDAAWYDPAMARNELAWLRSTSPQDNLRDGNQAVIDAKRACELSSWSNDEYLVTLSAALAETGQFKDAIKWLEKARELNPKVRPEIRERMLGSFKAEKPYREDPKERIAP
jgi:serine/threonine-protein kinase